ncbi:hybrid sensor histidine kinase/response regulator [Halalkalirubrum salinum]|uniref:hybrid sensor histidine kinase/response regulator n=1 Tax=Halalkalirubrum salinum TaxID=2563889 RepID=UPI0010FADD79|nr:ATP-binding protein [Halalkalirubrum salinum]
MGGSISVLHVDDEPEFGELTATFLERSDDRLAVEPVSRPADALDRADEADCIVSDYDMPGMNGIELLDAIRTAHGEMPFILFTGKGNEEVASDAISAGVTDYLQKDRGVDQYTILANRITNAVEQHRSRHQLEIRERELAETNAVLRTILETLPEGVFVEDMDDRVVVVNEAFCSLFDLPVEASDCVDRSSSELLAKTVRVIDSPDSYPDDIETLRANRDRVESETIELSNGCVLQRTFIPDELPTGPANLWVFQDVTDSQTQNRKLETLQERSQRLMYATTKTEVAEIATDAADEIIGAPLTGIHFLNEAGDEISLAAYVDTLPAAFDSLPRYPKNSPPGSRAALAWAVFTENEPVYIEDTETSDRLTEETPARSVIIHPIDSYGLFIVSSESPQAFDETDIRLVEILATATTAALDRVEREQRLKTSRRELERQNERLEAFASVISHDLRNPLTLAHGHLDLVGDTVDHPSIEAIERAHDRMVEIIDDTLSLAREGRIVDETEPVSVASIAERCWNETTESRLNIDGDVRIHADPARLQTMLENLFRNSVEHGSTGNRAPPGDAIEHGTENGDEETLVVTIGEIDGGFFISDNGHGIPPKNRESIFEAGYTTSESGTGFGLAIVSEIAEAHGWTVRVTDAENGGARFEFTDVESATTEMQV